MRIHLLAVGTRQPRWVVDGFNEYARRLPRQCAVELVEIPVVRRGGSVPAAVAVEREGERLLAAVPTRARLVALDERGDHLDTLGLARRLEDWMAGGEDVAIMIGGPDGLASACIERAALTWSLSALTLPHGLVRVLLAEQLYRAWSVTAGHPYHRP